MPPIGQLERREIYLPHCRDQFGGRRTNGEDCRLRCLGDGSTPRPRTYRAGRIGPDVSGRPAVGEYADGAAHRT